MSTSTTVQTSVNTAARPVWAIDPVHSSAAFSVKHMVVSTARGRFGALSGEILADPARPSDASVTATIDATSIDTNDERRDTHLRSADFFDVERFPVLSFQSTSVDVRAEGHWLVHGDLTIRDTTRPITLDVTFDGSIVDAYGMNRAAFTAATSINRKEFGLHWNGLIESGGAIVGDTVKIELNVAAVQQNQ